MKKATIAIHKGQSPDPSTGAVIPPIYMTSTYAQEYPNETKGYDYTRAGNPNFTNLEAQIAGLENGKFATVFASGLSAITAIAATMDKGEHVIATNDLYGGTYRLFTKVLSRYDIGFSTIDTQDLAAVEEALKSKPKYLFLESPTNPLLNISDISAISKLAQDAGTLCVVDNTFASAIFQNPLDLGADIVMHSTTKYMGGHSDTVGGVLITNDENLKAEFDFGRFAIGLNPSPFDTWLCSKGIKTLAIRMERHAENAMYIATELEKHPKVKKVYYPGLPSHHNHEIAKKQMTGFSGMISVTFDASLEETKKIISSFSLFTLAESLGGVESLVDHPASMTHASIPAEERAKIGLEDGLVRFSIGIEDKDDLLKDILNQL